MSKLGAFPLKEWIEMYKLVSFIETGTYLGDGVLTALDHGINFAVSSELNSRLADRAVDRIRQQFETKLIDGSVRVFCEDSVTALPKMLAAVSREPALVFLDAHVSEGFGGIESDPLPLSKEIGVLKANRDCSRDVIIIDDMHINTLEYWDKKSIYGKAPEFKLAQDIADIFKSSHIGAAFREALENHPVLILLPQGAIK